MRRILLSLCVVCLFVAYLPVLAQVDRFVAGEFPPHVIYRIQAIDDISRLSEQSLHNLALYFIRQDSLATKMLHGNGFHASLARFYQTPIDELRGVISDLEFNDYKIGIRSGRLCQLREIVFYREQIKLKQSEIRALLLHSDEVEMKIGQKGFKQREVEHCLADSIIGQEKFLHFYSTKYQDKIRTTIKKWYTGMKKYHLVDIRNDSTSVCASLLCFENERLSYYEYWKNAGSIVLYNEAMRVDKFKKPESLKRLEIYEKLPSWSLIPDIFDNKEQIKLTTAQTNLLFGIPERFERLKEEKKKRKEKFLQRGLEYSLVEEVLASVQINMVLKKKYRNEVQKNVEKDIETLGENGLLRGRDVGEVSKELLDYQLDLKIANVLVELEKSREHVFERYDLENNKPELIKKLEEIRKQEKQRKKVQFQES